MSRRRIESRVRYASVLGIAGVAVIAFSLWWKAPVSFVFFAALGPLLILLGVGSFLWSLVTSEETP